MSSAIFNRIGQDSTEIEFIQFGDNTTQTTLRDELLDGEKSYVFGITSLNVPLHDCPMHPITEENVLFTIYRINGGTPFAFSTHPQYALFLEYQGLLVADPATTFPGYAATPDVAHSFRTRATVDENGAAFPNIDEINAATTKAEIETAFTEYYQNVFNPGSSAPLFEPEMFEGTEWSFKINPEKSHSSVNDFMQSVHNFVQTFNFKMTQMGIERTHFGLAAGRNVDGIFFVHLDNLVKYLEIVQQPDTSLIIQGTRDFWDCFFIEFSLYGIQLFGLKKTSLLNMNGRYYLALQYNGVRFHRFGG